MKTTVHIDDNLYKEAKLQAARRGITINALIEEALRESLTRQHVPQGRKPVRLVTFGGKGLHPEVNLDDYAGLSDLMAASDSPG
jgi:hypothetical protein